MTQKWNAFVNEQWTMTGEGTGGTLAGLRFGVKDVFELEGYTASAGNPDWLRTHAAATATAPALQRLLAAGAVLHGTTQTDELMYSLNGQNVHYGTPVNPAAPDRIPGGSSSGSAVVVAAGLREFAIGTDTGGSVRIPASYCGIYGMRPTHGAIDMNGVIPLAPGFDTIGWMANSAELLYRIGSVLLSAGHEHDAGTVDFEHVYIPEEAWAATEPQTAELLRAAAARLLEQRDGAALQPQSVSIAPEGLPAWMTAFRTVQAIEIWEQHGQWIETVQPVFAEDIDGRFRWASTLRRHDHAKAFMLKQTVRERLRSLLGHNGLLMLPTATGPAPQLHIDGVANEQRRSQTMQLSSIAGLSGLPQITIPAGTIDGAPVGLSVIAGAGQDLRLLQWVQAALHSHSLI